MPAGRCRPAQCRAAPTSARPAMAAPARRASHELHRYIFTVHALKTDKLDLGADSSGALVGYMLNGNALGKASFTGLYGR